jgi:hypothetical protein
MYVKAKMIPVGTVPGTGGNGDEGEQWMGVNSNMIYLIHCKYLCKCYNLPTPSTTITKKKENREDTSPLYRYFPLASMVNLFPNSLL